MMFDAQGEDKNEIGNRGYCGKELIIETVEDGFYYVKNSVWDWKDWMLEGSTTQHTIQRRKFSPIGKAIY